MRRTLLGRHFVLMTLPSLTMSHVLGDVLYLYGSLYTGAKAPGKLSHFHYRCPRLIKHLSTFLSENSLILTQTHVTQIGKPSIATFYIWRN